MISLEGKLPPPTTLPKPKIGPQPKWTSTQVGQSAFAHSSATSAIPIRRPVNRPQSATGFVHTTKTDLSNCRPGHPPSRSPPQSSRRPSSALPSAPLSSRIHSARTSRPSSARLDTARRPPSMMAAVTAVDLNVSGLLVPIHTMLELQSEHQEPAPHEEPAMNPIHAGLSPGPQPMSPLRTTLLEPSQLISQGPPSPSIQWQPKALRSSPTRRPSSAPVSSKLMADHNNSNGGPPFTGWAANARSISPFKATVDGWVGENEDQEEAEIVADDQQRHEELMGRVDQILSLSNLGHHSQQLRDFPLMPMGGGGGVASPLSINTAASSAWMEKEQRPHSSRSAGGAVRSGTRVIRPGSAPSTSKQTALNSPHSTRNTPKKSATATPSLAAPSPPQPSELGPIVTSLLKSTFSVQKMNISRQSIEKPMAMAVRPGSAPLPAKAPLSAKPFHSPETLSLMNSHQGLISVKVDRAKPTAPSPSPPPRPQQLVVAPPPQPTPPPPSPFKPTTTRDALPPAETHHLYERSEVPGGYGHHRSDSAAGSYGPGGEISQRPLRASRLDEIPRDIPNRYFNGRTPTPPPNTRFGEVRGSGYGPQSRSNSSSKKKAVADNGGGGLVLEGWDNEVSTSVSPPKTRPDGASLSPGGGFGVWTRVESPTMRKVRILPDDLDDEPSLFRNGGEY